jgi:hypothetical protein
VSSSSVRGLIVIGYVGWALCVLYLAGCLVAPSLLANTGCELTPGGSVFGVATRSWVPPGTTCTYDLSQYGITGDVVIGPSPLRLLFVAPALIGLPLIRRFSRTVKRQALIEA